jgi:hypothetical protein
MYRESYVQPNVPSGNPLNNNAQLYISNIFEIHLTYFLSSNSNYKGGTSFLSLIGLHPVPRGQPFVVSLVSEIHVAISGYMIGPTTKKTVTTHVRQTFLITFSSSTLRSARLRRHVVSHFIPRFGHLGYCITEKLHLALHCRHVGLDILPQSLLILVQENMSVRGLGAEAPEYR